MINRRKKCLSVVTITSDIEETKRPYAAALARGFRYGGRAMLTKYG